MKIVVSRKFSAPAQRVWDIVGDFAGCARWCLVGSCTVRGTGIGAIRRVTGSGGGMADELHLEQQLTELDHDARAIAYTMTDVKELPWSSYHARIVVSELSPGSEVVWTCHVEPRVSETEVSRGIAQTYEKALRNLSRLVEVQK